MIKVGDPIRWRTIHGIQYGVVARVGHSFGIPCVWVLGALAPEDCIYIGNIL